jgi:hypothetical protein
MKPYRLQGMFTRRITGRARACVPFAVVLAAALVGCGGSSENGVASKSASEILAASRTAAESATSVHIISNSFQGPLKAAYNLELARNGGHAQISIIGVSFEVLRIGGAVYLKGSHAFHKSLSGVAASVPQDRWLKVPVNNVQLSRLASFTKLSPELGRILSSAAPRKGASTTVNGQSAIELDQTGGLFSSALYVATTGKPYPIQLIKHGKETGQTTFSGWNEPVSFTRPANAIAIG